MTCFMSLQPRSTSRSCLYPRAMSSAGSLGSEVRSRYLPSRFSSALILAASTRRRPPGVTRRYRFRPGLVEMTPQLGAFGGGQRVAAGDHLFELGEHPGPHLGIALGGLGVEADDEPL